MPRVPTQWRRRTSTPRRRALPGSQDTGSARCPFIRRPCACCKLAVVSMGNLAEEETKFRGSIFLRHRRHHNSNDNSTRPGSARFQPRQWHGKYGNGRCRRSTQWYRPRCNTKQWQSSPRTPTYQPCDANTASDSTGLSIDGAAPVNTATW